MNRMQTTHNGHEIYYNESDDTWFATVTGQTAKTLSALKTKLNAMDAVERKLGDGVRCICFNYSRMSFVEATMLDKPTNNDGHVAVWVRDIISGDRQKVGVHALAPDTPENRVVLEEAKKLKVEADALVKKAEAMIKGIKRFTAEDLKAAALGVKPE